MNTITENPLLKNVHSANRATVLKKFKELTKCNHDDYLYLHKFLEENPQQFYDCKLFDDTLNWLIKTDTRTRTQLKQYFEANNKKISQALFHLSEINSLNWHDELLPSEDLDRMRLINGSVNPMYLRLIEGVLAPLAHPMAFFSRKDRGKDTEGLDIWNIVQELSGGDLDRIKDIYDNTIRNGIAHGGVSYSDIDVKYEDKKGNSKTVIVYDVFRLFDNLLDYCNALSLSFGVFLLSRKHEGYEIPEYMQIEELRARTKTSYWQVDTCIPSLTLKGNQLTTFVRTNTRDFNKVRLSAFQTGLLSGLLAAGYDRYFLSIQSGVAPPGFAAFSGKEIEKLRKQAQFDVSDCKDVLEDGLVFYVPRPKLPKILSIINTFALSFKIHIPLIMKACSDDFRKQMYDAGITRNGRAKIIVRNATIHRSGWRSVLKGEVVISPTDDSVDEELIRGIIRKTIRKTARNARKRLNYWNLYKFLPLGYTYISLFNKDYRRRRLTSYGLGSELICTVRVLTISRIKVPDIQGGTIENMGKYRIAWNKLWATEVK